MTGSLRLGRFYARRVRRLLPAALVVIVATSLLFVLIASSARRVPLVGDAQSALLYVANWHFLAQSGDYFATGVDKSPFLHFWSLAIEEQYYVVFPLLARGCSAGPPRRRTVGVLAALLALSLGSQLVWAHLDSSHAYYGTDARLYQLLAGSLCAVAIRTWNPRVAPRTAGSIAAAGLALVLVLGSGLVDLSASLRGVGATVASALVISGLVLDGSTRPARLLARPVPVFLGRISYGTYLWHWPVILAATTLLDVGPGVVAALALAWRPGWPPRRTRCWRCRSGGRSSLDRMRWYPAVAGVAASALVAATVVPWALQLGPHAPSSPPPTRPPAGRGGGCRPRRPRPGRHRLERRPRGPRHGGLLRRPHRREVHRRHGIGTARAAGRRQPGADARPDVRADREGARADAVAQRPCRLPVAGGADQPQGLAPRSSSAARTPASGGTTTCCRSCGPDVVVVLDRPRDDPDEWQDVAAAAGRPAAVARDRDPPRRAGTRCARSPTSCPAPCWWSASSCRRPSTRPSACPPSERASRCAVRVPRDASPHRRLLRDRGRPVTPGRHARPQPGLLPRGPGVRRGGRRPGGAGATTTTSPRATPPPGATRRGRS